MIKSSNKLLSGINLKFKKAVTNSLYALFTSGCIAFSSSYTTIASFNSVSNGVHVASVYLVASKPLTLSMNAFKAVLSPLKNSNFCIALASLSNAAFISGCIAFSSSYTSLASCKAALNSFTTTGITLSKLA